MNPLEQNSAINTMNLFLQAQLPPILGNAQVAAQITARIAATRPSPNTLKLPTYCQYPNPSKMDDFNTNQGLGGASLQGAIDALNNFKTNCKNTIKTKLEATGPEASKDSKLALGATTLLKEVLQAAKCFTSIVKNVNNLVDSYISAIDRTLVAVANQISTLQSQMGELVGMLNPSGLMFEITGTLISRLAATTDVFETLALINEIQAEFIQQVKEIQHLGGSMNRAIYHFESCLLLIQTRALNLIHFMSILGALNQSRVSAQSAYMADDFLDDFDVKSFEALSFDWSATNSAALPEYSFFDDYAVIDKLDALCRQFDPMNTFPVIIASRQSKGVLVVPQDGLLSCGIDTQATSQVTLILELSIDDGATTVIARAVGSPPPAGQILVKNSGVYAAFSAQTISYGQATKMSADTYRLTLTPGTAAPALGTSFYFEYPGTRHFIGYTVSEKAFFDDTPNHNPQTPAWSYRQPLPFRVVDTSHNTVLLQRWSLADLEAVGYLVDLHGVTTPHVMLDYFLDIPNCLEELFVQDYMSVFSTTADKTTSFFNYILANKDGEFLKMSTADLGKSFIDANFHKNPQAWNDYVKTLTPKDQHYNMYILTSSNATMHLKLHDPNKASTRPHVGDRIPCTRGWVLRAYIVGEPNAVRKTHFIKKADYEKAVGCFMQAHWGFIPDPEIAKSLAVKKVIQVPWRPYVGRWRRQD